MQAKITKEMQKEMADAQQPHRHAAPQAHSAAADAMQGMHVHPFFHVEVTDAQKPHHFSPPKAQKETEKALKEAVEASQQHWLSDMKLPHQHALDKELKHAINEPSSHAGQGP